VGSARMGEMCVSSTAGDELVAIGLGSCIGLAMVDRAAHVAGLAHVVLPESGGAAGPAPKFADLAVPALLDAVRRAGGRKDRLEVVLVGGARMFAMGGGLDIGARNDAAVREALHQRGLRVRAAETGGSSGRTVRVHVADGTVLVHQAGGKPVAVLGSGAGSGAARSSAARSSAARSSAARSGGARSGGARAGGALPGGVRPTAPMSAGRV
jgi:chemotaxis protein CheD